MVDVVPLIAGSVLVLIGFLAAQLFDRYRIPDYIVLIGIGIVLGSGVLPLGQWDPRPFLSSVQPLLLSLAIAFILFEGGLALHLRGLGRTWAYAAGHSIAVIVLSILGVWLVGTLFLGLGSTTSLILGVAMCAPSAAIVLSFLPRLRVGNQTKFALTLEGILGNIVAAALVLLLIRFSDGAPASGQALFLVGFYAALAFVVAALVGLAWDRAVGAARRPSFLYMATVAIAILLFGVGEGFLDGNGGLMAFAFGLVLGHWGRTPLRPQGVATPGSRYLQEFHREFVFLLRTFFFVYLGTLINLSRVGPPAVAASIILVAVFIATRYPTTGLLARAWNLPKVDVRVLRAVVARGLTDTVLVLYAITIQVIPPSEAGPVADFLFMVVVLAALVSAILVSRAERTAVPAPPPAPSSAASEAPTSTPSRAAFLPPPPSDTPPPPPPELDVPVPSPPPR